MSFNKVILMGNLTRDVEVKTTSGNSTVGLIGIAVNRSYKTQAGERREETTFVDCEAWGRTAEVMAQYLFKGSRVLIEGRLKMDQWDDKSGQRRSKLKVVVESFDFADSKGEQRPQPQRRPAPVAAQAQYDPIDEDSIPF